MSATTKETSQSSSDDRVTVRDLTGAPRGAFVLVGMAALLAGGFAVFESANQAGTVALVAVGAIASLLAVVGKLPLRWVIGGHEFDMSEKAARAAAEVVASHLGPTETAELTDRLESVEGRRLSPMTSAMLDHVNFERIAISRVLAAVTRHGWNYVDASGRDRGADGFVVAPGGRRVPIEYKLVRHRSVMRSRITELIHRYSTSELQNPVIVVSGPPLAPNSTISELVSSLQSPKLRFVFLDDPEFDANLEAALEEALLEEQ